MMCHRTIAVHDKNEKIKQKKQCMIKIEIEILNRKKTPAQSIRYWHLPLSHVLPRKMQNQNA